MDAYDLAYLEGIPPKLGLAKKESFMSLNVYIALWHMNTRAGDQLTWNQKAVNLGAQIDLAEKHFKNLGAGNGAFKLFVAPEYYFADLSTGEDLIRGYDVTDQQAVLGQLRGLSQDHPNMLLLGGTIAWKTQLRRGERDQINQQIKAAQAQLAQLNPNTSWHKEAERARQNIRLKGSNIQGKLSGQPKLRWFGYNAAFACFNGNVLGEIRKSTNVQEFSGENPADNVVMIPGTSAGTFSVPGFKGLDGTTGLKVGVEICGDHGRIGQFKERVDIHVLLAASQVAGSTYADTGGIFIHCDSYRPPRVDRAVTVGNFQDRKKITDAPNTVADKNHFLYVQKVTLGKIDDA